MQAFARPITDALRLVDKSLTSRGARAAFLVAVTVLLAPRPRTFPHPGIDPGWKAALVNARSLGLHHGEQIMFTYGPWGWISIDTFTSRAELVMSVAFGIAAAGSYATAMWLLLRRTLSPAISAIVLLFGALPVAQWLATDELMLVAVFCLAFLNLQPEGPGSWGIALMSGLAASMLQVKFSTGLFATLALPVTIVGLLNRVRRVMTATAVYITVTGVAWVIAERRAAGFFTWLDYSLDYVSHYAGGMSVYPDRPTDLLLFGLVGTATVAFAVRRPRSSDDSMLVHVAVLALAGLSVVTGLRMGFVRHEVGRVITAFHVVVPAWITVTAATGKPRRLARMLAPITLSVVYLASPDIGVVRTVGDLANWPQKLALWIEPTNIVLSRGSAAESAEKARTTGRDAFALSDRMLETIGDRGVHVDPWNTTLPWTFGLRWSPIPVFQTYAVLGHELDLLNQRAALSRTVDEPILINTDSRFAAENRPAIWTSPRYQLTLTCEFAPERIEGPWELWSRRPTTACGAPEVIGGGTVDEGDEIVLPADDGGLTMIRFTPSYSASDRLFALALKPRRPVTLTIADRPFRNPDGLSGAPLLVSCPDRVESKRFELLCPGPRSIGFSHSGSYTLERISFMP
jgi:hypothetical protein